MDFLRENLTLLYNTSGWSYDTLMLKINEGLPITQQFSRDQIRSYEKGFSAPKPHFKNVFAKFLGLEVKDIITRKLTEVELSEIINKNSEGEGASLPYNLEEHKRKLDEQWELIKSQQRTIENLSEERLRQSTNNSTKNGSDPQKTSNNLKQR